MARPCVRRPQASGPETRERGADEAAGPSGMPGSPSLPPARGRGLPSSAFQQLEDAVPRGGMASASCLVVALPAVAGWSLAGNRSVGTVLQGVKHGVVRHADEVIDVPAGHVPGGKRGQQVDGAPGGLDPCEVARRQCGCRMPGEPLPGEGQGSRPDEFRGRHAMPSGGLSDQGPLGVGEPDRARPARPAMRTPGRAPRGGILLLTAGQPCGSVAAAGGHARPDRAGPAARVSRFPPGPGSGAGSGRG